MTHPFELAQFRPCVTFENEVFRSSSKQISVRIESDMVVAGQNDAEKKLARAENRHRDLARDPVDLQARNAAARGDSL